MSKTILVELVVSRYKVFEEDKMVQVWGHVGDYEVCLYLQADDARVSQLLTAEKKDKRPKK